MRRCYLNKRKLKKIFKAHFGKSSDPVEAEITSRYCKLARFVGEAKSGYPVCLDANNEYLSVPKQLHKYIGKRS